MRVETSLRCVDKLPVCKYTVGTLLFTRSRTFIIVNLSIEGEILKSLSSTRTCLSF